MNNLPKNFDEFSDNKKQSFIHIKDLKEDGHGVVGVFSAISNRPM